MSEEETAEQQWEAFERRMAEIEEAEYRRRTHTETVSDANG